MKKEEEEGRKKLRGSERVPSDAGGANQCGIRGCARTRGVEPCALVQDGCKSRAGGKGRGLAERTCEAEAEEEPEDVAPAEDGGEGDHGAREVVEDARLEDGGPGRGGREDDAGGEGGREHVLKEGGARHAQVRTEPVLSHLACLENALRDRPVQDHELACGAQNDTSNRGR